MNLENLILSFSQNHIIVLFTKLPSSKGRHLIIDSTAYIFIDKNLPENEAINVLLHEKEHLNRKDYPLEISHQNRLYNHIEHETETNRIIDFLNLVNNEYPIDESFNYTDYMTKAFIPAQYENLVKETAKRLYQDNKKRGII